MYECYDWCECYPSERFKYPWDIVTFVISEKRLERTDNITNDQYQLIERCWCHQPNERLKIEDIISILETEIVKIQQPVKFI